MIGRRLALVGLLAVLLATVPGSAEPLLGPDEALPIDRIRPGMRGVGKSVFQGTHVETFKVTVLGVLRKIDFGGDMILIRVESGPVVRRNQGISSGMSGSPIYVDGKLIGALAYAWPFSKEPIAGVTPIHQMLEAFEPGSSGLHASGSLAPAGRPLAIGGQPISRVTVLPEAVAGHSPPPETLFLAPVATPLMVSGMGRAGIDALQRKLNRYNIVAMPGPGRVAPGEIERAPKLEPGAAVGAQLVDGDVEITAIGTVTWVKGDRVVAFGHPLFGLGSVDLPMTTAYVHGVLSSAEVSFKLASPVATVGKVSQDRNWSIGGRLGEQASLVPSRFRIRDLDRGVSRDYSIRSIQHRNLTSLVIYSSLLNAIGSVAPPSEGTTRSTLEVTARGLPPVRRENLFVTGGRSTAFEQLFADPFAQLPMGELLQVLDTLENNPFGPIPVERIEVDVEITQSRRSATIERVYADRKRVKPGETVRVGVVIQPYHGEKETRELTLLVPKNIPAGRIQIGVAGGQSARRTLSWLGLQRPPARTVPQLLADIVERERNNDLVVEMTLPVAGLNASGRELPDLPNSLMELLLTASPTGVRAARGHQRQVVSTPWSLTGGQILSLVVETEERDKVGATPMPGLFPGLSYFGTLFEELYRYGSADAPVGDEAEHEEEGDEASLNGWEPGARSARHPSLAPLAQRGETQRHPPIEPPRMPSWAELDELARREVSELSIDSLTSTGGRRGLVRAASVWRQASARDFATGKPEGALITSKGEVRVAPKPLRVHHSADRFLLGQVADRNGNLYVGGWLDGGVLRVDREGRVTPFFDTGDVAVQALALDREENLYVGALPGGQITRIRPDGTATPLCKLENAYIWALQCDPAGNLYAATGNEGKLYRVSPDGRAEVVFTAPDRHVWTLAAFHGNRDSDWRLYFSTYPKGKVYCLDGSGRVRAVFEAPKATVQSLATDATGNLYVGTSPRAAIYRIAPDGAVTTLLQSTERHVMSLATDAAGNLYAGVGPGGKLYRITPDKTVAMLFDPQTSYVLSLLVAPRAPESKDGHEELLLATAGPGSIYRLPLDGAGEGVFVSAVHDAGGPARWGTLRWNAAPNGGPVRLQTRSGNTAYPDATWSDWSPVYDNATGQSVVSPPGQFIQYRALLHSADGKPAALQSVELYYMTRNRAPEVTLTAPAANAVWSGQKNIQWSAKDPDRDRLTYELFYAPEGSQAWKKLKGTSGGSALESRLKGALAGAQKPADAGEAAEGTEAEEEEEDPESSAQSTELLWNTRQVPDGRYRIKVVASDALANPTEPLTAEAISEVVIVDNTPPVIELNRAAQKGEAPPTEVWCRDALSPITGAEYRVGQGDWIGAAAADGIFDSPVEAIRIDPARLPPGHQTLTLRVRDAAGNERTATLPYRK